MLQDLKVEFQNSVKNLSAEVKRLELAYNKTIDDNFVGQISNVSADVANIREASSQHYSQIQALNQVRSPFNQGILDIIKRIIQHKIIYINLRNNIIIYYKIIHIF